MRGQIAIAVARAIVPEVIRAIQARPTTATPDAIAAAVMPAAERAAANAVPDAEAVPVKSAMASKINWAAGGTAVVALMATFGLDLSPEMQAAVATIAATVGPALIIILRTWFTKAVTRGSVKG